MPIKFEKPRRGAGGEEITIVNSVNKAAQEIMEPWKDRNDQWVRDRLQLEMKYKTRQAPFELILTNDIPVQHAFATAILAGKDPVFTMPISGTEESTERNEMNKSERLADGIWREMDRHHRRQGNGGLLNDIMFYANLGSICVFPRIQKTGNTHTFHMTVYDPLNCYPEFGEEGLLRWVRVYTTTPSDAISLAVSQGWDEKKLDTKADVIQIINMWETSLEEKKPKFVNTVLMSGVLMKEPTDHTKQFSCIPIQMIGVNGIPTQPYTDPFLQATQLGAQISRGTSQNWGRPVFYMNREWNLLPIPFGVLCILTLAQGGTDPIMDVYISSCWLSSYKANSSKRT